MPRPPQSAPALAAIGEAVFSPLATASAAQPRFPLHVGDTWLEPPPGARMEDLRGAAYHGLHRYSDTRGIPELVNALLEKVRERNAIPCERDSLLVTAGATAGLSAGVGALATPGEEILILAPFWPLIPGIVRTFGARPVEVPFYDRVDSAEAAVEAVRRHATPRSVALYLSTPSNPTGRVLPQEWLAALADWARRENLWLLSDEVYEELVYRGEHVSIARFAPERTLTAFSFSKAWAMAGNRVGYLVGPASLLDEVHKVTTHTVYSAPTPAQLAALRVLHGGRECREWLERARAHYRDAGEAAAEALGLPAPQGSTFLFLDVAQRLDRRGMRGFLEDCLEDGVLVAPGASSGAAYESWVRLCYTVCPPEATAQAVRRLAARLGGSAGVPRAAGGRPR